MTSPGHQIPGEVGSRDECQQLCTEEEVGLLLYIVVAGLLVVISIGFALRRMCAVHQEMNHCECFPRHPTASKA